MSFAARRAIRAVPGLVRPVSQWTAVSNRSVVGINSLYKYNRFLGVSKSSVRWYSPQSLDEPAKVVAFEHVNDLSNKEDTVLVDVREPDEYKEGHIPGAINIPFRSSPGALGLEPAEFEDAFGFPKPDPSKTLVFYCKGGVRSSSAEQLAATYGYKSRLNYKGSMADWSAQNGKIDVPKTPGEQQQQHQ